MPPVSIDREAVRRLMTEGAQVLEVLPAQAYDKEHLAGAISFSRTAEIERRGE